MIKANEIKILVAEDDSELRESIAKLFRIFGFQVSTAKDGAEAYEIAKAVVPNIVLTDVRMPNKGGIELIEKLRAEAHNTPKIFAISGFTDCSVADILDIGADGFFSKPFDATAVRHTINNTLLDPVQRWTTPVKNLITQEINKKIRGLADAKTSREFLLGRGGFFASSKYEKPKPGDYVKFKIDILDSTPHTRIEGIGQVAWTREKEDGALPAGTAVEFKQLDPYFLQKFLAWTDEHKVIPYIPKG